MTSYFLCEMPRNKIVSNNYYSKIFVDRQAKVPTGIGSVRLW
jgi:mannitol/fructose-specific phosphotransferase system IIA component (Ntr-type)